MIYTLTTIQFELITSNYKKRKINSSEVSRNKVSIDFTDDEADDIREWAIVELQKTGFDINYNLTDEGKLLQEIIDVFEL
jgi:hypothetical protein